MHASPRVPEYTYADLFFAAVIADVERLLRKDFDERVRDRGLTRTNGGRW